MAFEIIVKVIDVLFICMIAKIRHRIKESHAGITGANIILIVTILNLIAISIAD